MQRRLTAPTVVTAPPDIEPFEDALTHAILVCMAQDRMLTELHRELVLAYLEIDRLRRIVERPISQRGEFPKRSKVKKCERCGEHRMMGRGAKFCSDCRKTVHAENVVSNLGVKRRNAPV